MVSSVHFRVVKPSGVDWLLVHVSVTATVISEVSYVVDDELSSSQAVDWFLVLVSVTSKVRYLVDGGRFIDVTKYEEMGEMDW